MHARRVATALGAGLATVVLVGGTLTAILPFEFSAIVGLPLGILAGLAAGFAVADGIRDLDSSAGRLATAVASFGYAVLALAAASYVNLAGVRETLSAPQWVAVGLGVAVVVYAVITVVDRRRDAD